MIPFSKYSGCGNDFILLDCRKKELPLSSPSIVALCDRHRGVGADGVIFLESSSLADYKMRIFNADGNEAEMCGNGLRCLARFASCLGETKRSFSVETMHRLLRATLNGKQIEIEIGDVKEIILKQEVIVANTPLPLSFLNTGVPHAVLFVDALASFDLKTLGPLVRHHPFFGPAGTNFTVAEVKGEGHIAIRTYERGVEGETLACGTGAAAAALVAHLIKNAPSPVKVDVLSGETLTVSFTQNGGLPTALSLSGPANWIFDGHFSLDSLQYTHSLQDTLA